MRARGPAYYLNEEQGGRIFRQASGYADVYKRGAFAWENKAPGKNLDAALRQLLGYTLALQKRTLTNL